MAKSACAAPHQPAGDDPFAGIVLTLGEAFELVPDAVVLIDDTQRVVLANAGVSRVLGYTRTELVGERLECLIPPRFRANHARMIAGFRVAGQAIVMSDRPVLPALHKSGEEVPVSISIANLELGGGKLSIAVIRDATPVRNHLGEVTARAESDALTGLGNRAYLSRRIATALQSGRAFGLLFMDLTSFKPFNDTYGHAMGDEVLQLVARRLKALVRTDDAAARLGGDEFVLVLSGLREARDLQSRARGVADSLSQPFHIGSTRATVGVNIGGALCPRDGKREADLLAVADRNMYRAKKAGRSHCTDPATA